MAIGKLINKVCSFYNNNDAGNIQLTVGRARTAGASAGVSTNIVSGTTLAMPSGTTAYYMAAWPSMPDSKNEATHLNGFALDKPGATGSYYYTIWMSSDESHTYSSMTSVLTVLNVSP